MNPQRLADDFAVAPQIAPEDVAELAALGFRTVICNRPDGEEPGQPAFAEIAAAAAAAGLTAVHVPVVSGGITEENVADFRAAIAEAPGPIFAYCRSGTRSRNLWNLTHPG